MIPKIQPRHQRRRRHQLTVGRVGAGLIRPIELIGPIGPIRLIAVIVKVGEGYTSGARGAE